MPRGSGILLHPSSFPSPYGIGDFGSSAYRFIDFLMSSHQHYWQILPMGPTGYGNSPYLSYSVFAGNHLLISPELLEEQGWLDKSELANSPDFPLDHIDFDGVIAFKDGLFRLACARFRQQATPAIQKQFEQFCIHQSSWLDDYSLFMACKYAHPNQSWYQWEPNLRQRKPGTLALYRKQFTDEIFYHQFLQYQFHCQWNALKTYANDQSITIIGDIPIYVAHDSADVWANPENFHLDEKTGEVALMAGVPPDYFSETGQLWGNPVYNWRHLKKNQFKWWVQRFKSMLEVVDVIRVDHFRGFESYWAVPKGETTAINGEWVQAPGEELFTTLAQKLGSLPIMAEDLGVITPEVEALRDRFDFPGMNILQFAFDSDARNPYLTFQYRKNSIVYTGTHDNDTTVGWFYSRSDDLQRHIRSYLGYNGIDGIHWDLIRHAMSSVANWALFPFQDILGLGTDARMNTPGTATGNWDWRYRTEAVECEEICHRLRYFTDIYGRSLDFPPPRIQTDEETEPLESPVF